MNKLRLLFLSATIVLSTGCATMFNGSNQTVNIRTNDAEAKIYVNEEYMGKKLQQLFLKNLLIQPHY